MSFQRARPSSTTILSLLAAAFAACGERADAPSGTADVGPERRDSAGVAVLTYALGDLDGLPQEQGDTVPLLTIGAAEGPPGTTLNEVEVVRSLPDGTILVADDDGTVLRVYDASGRYVRSSGREGRAPGEFRRIVGFGALPGDSLVVYDRLNQRATVLDPELRFARTLSLPAPILLNGGFNTIGTSEFHSLGSVSAVALASRLQDDVPPQFTPPGATEPPPSEMGVVQDTLDLLLVRPTEGGPTPREEPLKVVLGSMTRRFGNGSGNVQLAADPYVGGNQTGFFFAHGSRFEVERYDPSGRLLWIARVDVQPRPVSAQEREERTRPLPPNPQLPPRAAAMLSRPRAVADHHPVFERVKMDASGNLWVKPDSAIARGRGWLRLGPDGELLGWHSDFPATPRHFGTDHVLAIVRDESGVERIVKYAFRP